MGVRCDISAKPTRYDLEDVFHTIQLPAGTPPRVVIAGVWLFLQVSDGDRTYDLSIDLARDGGNEVRLLKSFRVHLQDRLVVKNVAVKLPNFPCPRRGVYEFWLRQTSLKSAADFRDEDIIARASFRLEDARE
jgi:hypothetical protein